MQQQISIPFPLGEIPALINYPVGSIEAPAVLLLHGFGGNKHGDKDMLDTMANELCQQGFVTLQIDLCSCGENTAHKQEYAFNRLVKEASFCFSWLSALPKVDATRCGILGISLGARVAVVASHKLPVHFMILLNGALGDKYRAPWFFKDRMFTMQEECRTSGKTTYTNSSGVTFDIFPIFFSDLEHSDPDNIIIDYHKSLLVVYGDQDPTVDCRVSIETFQLAQGDKQLVVIEGADHTFNIKTDDQSKFKECCQQIYLWIKTVI